MAVPARVFHIVPLLLFFVVAGFFYNGLSRDPSLVPSPLIDKPAPEFQLQPLIEGQPGLGTADLRGQPTLVNFFASWCIPCRAEHPILNELARSRQVRLVGINYKDKPADALRWLSELGNPYALIGADNTGRVAIDFGVYGVPETYLVDAQGRIRFKHVGPLTPEVVKAQLLPALAELGKVSS